MVWGSSRHVGVGVAQNCHDASALAGGLDIPICQTYIIIHLAPKGNSPPRSQCFDGRDCEFIEVTGSKNHYTWFLDVAVKLFSQFIIREKIPMRPTGCVT